MRFVMTQRQSDTGIIGLSEMLISKSDDAETKSFGKQVSADYMKISASLTKIVAPMSVTLPEQIAAPELAAQNKLQGLSGTRLNRTYLKIITKGTKGRIKAYRLEAKKGRNSAVQRFATETLPVLEDHLQKAQALSRGMEKKT